MNLDHQKSLIFSSKKLSPEEETLGFLRSTEPSSSLLFPSASDNLSALISNFTDNSENAFNKNNHQLLKSLEIIKQTTGNLLNASPLFEQQNENFHSTQTLSNSLAHLMEEIVKLESIILYKSPENPVSSKSSFPKSKSPRPKSAIVKSQKTSPDWQHLAYTDTVTDLPNRRFFESFIQNILPSLKTPTSIHNQFYLVFIDIDNFKQINDTYGHEWGDSLLQTIAQRLKSNLREKDIVVRYGGDEFVAFIHPPTAPHQKDIDIHQIIARLMNMSDIPYKIDNTCMTITLSFGVSCYPDHGDTLEKLISCADKAMYAAKGSGKNRCTIAS